MTGRFFLLSLVVLLFPYCVAAQSRSDFKFPLHEVPARRCEKVCGNTPCEAVEFAGFSSDSTRFGYSHLVCPGPHTEARARLKYHLKELLKGKRKLSSKHVDVDGGKCPRCFNKAGLEVLELKGDRVDKNSFMFTAPSRVTVAVELKTEKAVAWYLTVEYEGKRIFRYRGEFEEIYFEFKPRVFLSPDGQKVAVVLHLDAMVKVDSTMALFSLNP